MSATHNALTLHNRHTGEQLELTRFQQGREVWLRLKGSLPPHQEGPPLHTHYEEDEEGVVIAGQLSGIVDGVELTRGPGETAQLPKGHAHRWWNGGEDTLAFEGVARPVVDLDRYLQAMFEVINAGPKGRPPLMYMAHVARRHRRTQAVHLMPAPIQGFLFFMAFALGSCLGRYRGTEWPGSPERCPGAPMTG